MPTDAAETQRGAVAFERLSRKVFRAWTSRDARAGLDRRQAPVMPPEDPRDRSTPSIG
jgi:hypothetical protein